jgi:hypothetical protein
MRNWFCCLFIATFASVPGSGESPVNRENDIDMTRYLPGKNDLAGWHARDDPQIARGDDLYLLIDGAAEIFHEYGFKRAVILSYGSEKGRSVNLEIYEMDDPAGAYGIYTFRTGGGGEEISIGDGGCLEDYYLNFWKGSFLVTVIGFDTKEETIDGIIAIAKAVETRIEEHGKKPHLTDLLPTSDLKHNGIKYLKGNLALYNNYEFDKTNIFGLSEGVIGTYGTHKIFIFSYKDEADSRKWFMNGTDRLRTSPAFHDFTQHENGCTMRDRSGNHLRIEPYRNFIIFVLGTENDTKSLMNKQRTRIDNLKRNR